MSAAALTPADILGPTGRIAARLPHYELRPQQLAMSEAVAAAIAERRHLIVEAGTGVGKSFGYLVPAIIAAATPRDDDEAPPPRVVVSTHTISLQEQLLQKDIPLLAAVMPLEFTAVLVKGRGNYLSLRRLDGALARAANLFQSDEEFSQLRDIADWAKKTSDGSLADLEIKPLPQVWDEVASDHGNCLGRQCPRFKECHYYQARRRATNAQVLIVNHALFFSDLALRREGASILPDYQVAIFDEAHTLEAVAGDHLGVSLASSQIEYQLHKLYNDRTNRGLLVHHKLGDAQRETLDCLFRCGEFFDSVRDWLQATPGGNGRVTSRDIVPNHLSGQLNKLSRTLREHAGKLTELEVKQDFSAAADRLAALASELGRWLAHDWEDSVYWVETTHGRRPRTTLCAAPINVGPALRETLFQRVPTVVMTSATLAVGAGGSFDYFRSRVGVTQGATLRLGSPFDYREQAELVLVDGLPDPSSARADYERRAIRLLRRYIAHTDGHAFALFTSYDMLRRAADDLAPWLAEHDLALYSQADNVSRSQMLDRFRQNPRAVLLGTDSFWQGVDVPGDALQTVIITKLPFSVPDRPLLAARLDAIRAAGLVPFQEYQLPEAVLKLKQGFGRLIRTRRDHGRVVILDPRVRTKPYGRMFLDSLPDCRRVVESADDSGDEPA